MKWKLVGYVLLVAYLILPATPALAATGETEVTGTVPLVVFEVAASNIGYYSATISWKTNGDATSQVFYDTAAHDNVADYANQTSESLDLVLQHSIGLTGLSSGTTYHYRVKSRIPETDFIAISEDYTFTTLTPSAPSGGDGGEPSYSVKMDLFGSKGYNYVSYRGEVQRTIEGTSADGNLGITIPRGTIAKEKDGTRLKSLAITAYEDPPAPPEGTHIIGLTYDFQPGGVTFDPPMTLTWKYDPDALPEGVDEEDLVIAYYDETAGEWVELDSTIDTENNVITASVPHFTTFAIIGTLKPAAFTLTLVGISPTEVAPGERVNISISVANTGAMEGSYTVVLKINGVKEAEAKVAVAAGKSERVTFTATKKEAGKYNVAVDGQSGSFIVVAPAPLAPPPPAPAPTPAPAPAPAPTPTPAPAPAPAPTPTPAPAPNWPLIGGIMIVVIVVGLIIFFLVRKRATLR